MHNVFFYHIVQWYNLSKQYYITKQDRTSKPRLSANKFSNSCLSKYMGDILCTCPIPHKLVHVILKRSVCYCANKQSYPVV